MLAHTTCIRIAGVAGRDGEHAGPSRGNLAIGGGGCGRRSQGGGSCTGEDEDDDESANDVLHDGSTPKVVFTSKRFRWTGNRSNHRMNQTISRMESVIY